MHEENNHSAKFTRFLSNERHGLANVFVFETETNHPSNKTARTKKTTRLIGILAIFFTFVAIVAIISSNISSVDPSPRKGKSVVKFGKAFVFL